MVESMADADTYGAEDANVAPAEESDPGSEMGVLSGKPNANKDSKAYKQKLAALQESELWWRRTAVLLALGVGSVSLLACGFGIGWLARGPGICIDESQAPEWNGPATNMLKPKKNRVDGRNGDGASRLRTNRRPSTTKMQAQQAQPPAMPAPPADYEGTPQPPGMFKQTAYGYGKEKTTACPAGSFTIPTLELCQEAAKDLQKRFVYSDVTGERGSPEGCLFRVPDEDITFNAYHGGLPNIERQVVCADYKQLPPRTFQMLLTTTKSPGAIVTGKSRPPSNKKESPPTDLEALR